MQTQESKLPQTTRIFYGAGDLGFSMTNSILTILYAIFLTDVVGLAPKMAAIAVFVGRSWDYINDPLMGYISDRTRSRWGRRRPFLLFGFIPFALAFMALWWIPPTNNEWTLVAYYALAYLVYDAAATFVYMPYYALTPELTEDYDERTVLTSYRMVFSIIGGLVAWTVPMMIIMHMQPENADKVLTMGMIFGAVGAIPLLLTFLGTREQPQFQTQEQVPFKSSIKAAIRNKPFLFAAGIFLFTWSGMAVIEGMMLYFLKYHMNMEAQSSMVAGAVFISALITLPVWERLSRKYDKRAAYVAGMLFLSAVVIVLIALPSDLNRTIVYALAALAGIGVGAVHVLPWSMIPDAVEWDEVHTGERHEGMFYSLVLLLRKVSSSITMPAVLLILEWRGFVSGAVNQSTSAVNAIRVLMGPFPSVLFVMGILFALFYPLGREKHAELRQELSLRRSASLGSD
ncbi:MAG: MFS transporter [Chloroflexota bacterium]